MSKKKFSSGLDSLFDTKDEEREMLNNSPQSLSQVGSVSEEKKGDLEAVSSVVTRRAASKNFTSDLDSLFNDAFSEAVEERVEKMRRSAGIDDPFDEPKMRSYKQPLSGLDALIRSTIDTSLAGLDHAAIKRLTIMVESQKIDKLKSIAKLERSFVKDIVNGMLTEFINDYEKRTGRSF